ncbi:MAG TPA: SdiA-regulated domain-containing protein [Kofleriaceae bacterium]|nr:SdiA-regulated domain-containing protein [Kofleriaceae bacterium]
MRLPCALLVTLAACAEAPTTIEPFLDLNKADGHPAHLEYLDRSRLDMEEPSDLVRVGSKLFAVSDQHSKIYEITPDGDADEYLDIDGHDLEALGYDFTRNEFLIADELKAKIWTIDEDGDRHDSIEVDNADDGNSGIEGIVVTTPDDRLFAVKEKDPARIYELETDGTLVDSKKIDFAKDLSGISYNASDKHIYVLSDEDHTLFRLDRHWDPDRAWKLPVDKPEGLAFSGNTLYIVSDSEDRIYTFELD